MTDERYGEGRFVDPEVGLLAGEASDQKVPEDRAATEGAAPFDVWKEMPSADGRAGDPTYYERPVLKEPTWVWAVPAYFFSGGAAGASAVLALVAQAVDREGLDRLVTRARWTAAAGCAAGTALLIEDLGRPERFLNMLRVFRPSSPMSVGSWVLATASPTSAGAALLAGAGGGPRAAGDAAGVVAGVAGLPLSGYTAVLLSNTAVPVWQATRRSLPLLFVASSVASAASILDLFDLSEREHAVVRRYGTVGRVAELVAGMAVERDADEVEQVGRALHEGVADTLWRASKALGAASLALSFLSKRSRTARKASAVLGVLGGLATRFAVFHAGRRSSTDPRATFRQQRAGRGAAEVTGRPAVIGPGDRRAVS